MQKAMALNAETLVTDKGFGAFCNQTRRGCKARAYSIRKEKVISHIVQIQTQVRETAAIQAACQRLGLAPPVNGQHKLFASIATGLGIHLPGWTYPVVCNTNTGQLQFDNFNGRWGNQTQLDQFLQAYACERTRIEARKKGYSVTEQPLQDGSIKLTIHVTGGAA